MEAPLLESSELKEGSYAGGVQPAIFRTEKGQKLLGELHLLVDVSHRVLAARRHVHVRGGVRHLVQRHRLEPVRHEGAAAVQQRGKVAVRVALVPPARAEAELGAAHHLGERVPARGGERVSLSECLAVGRFLRSRKCRMSSIL